MFSCGAHSATNFERLNSPWIRREPRLHDLRHTWATRCLAKLYQRGKDPNAELPVLATYLGHMNIACTTVYLHPSTDLLVQAGNRFQDHVNAQAAGVGGHHE
jgi:integrase